MKKSVHFSSGRSPVKPRTPKILSDSKGPKEIIACKSKNAAPVLTKKGVQLGTSKIRRFEEMFDTADLNNDGLIDQEDLGVLIKQLNMYATRKQVCKMIRAYDPDRTGFVDFKRFCQMMSAEVRMPPEEEAREMFNAIDRKGNGFVARSDLRRFFASFDTTVTVDDIEKIFQALDANNDGKLTLQKFMSITKFLK